MFNTEIKQLWNYANRNKAKYSTVLMGKPSLVKRGSVQTDERAVGQGEQVTSTEHCRTSDA